MSLDALGRHREAVVLQRMVLEHRKEGLEWIKAANNLAGSLSKASELAEAAEALRFKRWF